MIRKEIEDVMTAEKRAEGSKRVIVIGMKLLFSSFRSREGAQ